VNQRQCESDCQAGESLRGPVVGRAKDDEEEYRCQYDLRDDHRPQRVAAGRMFTESVGRHIAFGVEPRLSFGHDVDHQAGDQAADHLHDPVDINRFDPLVPWTGANQLGRDWCAQGADVEFWTNEQPPLLNKLDVNHVLTYLVDGERSMQWIADRFSGLPTTPNCGEF
jgi:hypothetical protein